MRRAFLDAASSADIFHTHGLWRMPGLYAARAARRAGKPLVISARGMLETAALRFSRPQKLLFWPAGQGRALFGAACLHATSEAELQTFRDLGLRNPVAVIPNGVDIPVALPAQARPEQRTLLYFGRIHPIKALDRLVAAWAQLESRHPGWRLRLVGPDERDYARELNTQCQRLGLQRVSFAGAAFGAEKQREFEGAQLYVLPSHSENFGMTVAEALSCAVPWWPAGARPGKGSMHTGCGRWVDNSVSSLTTCLDQLLSLPAPELSSMGLRGRAWMERDFSWASRAEQMLAVYEWLRDPQQPRPRMARRRERERAARQLVPWRVVAHMVSRQRLGRYEGAATVDCSSDRRTGTLPT